MSDLREPEPDPDTKRGWSLYHVQRNAKAKNHRLGFSRKRVR